MDLKDSLVNTNLLIYPSVKLMQFLENLPIKEDLPKNVINVIKGKPCEINDDGVEYVKSADIELSDDDFKKIAQVEDCLPTKEEPEEIIENKNESKDDNDKDSKAEKNIEVTGDDSEQNEVDDQPFLTTQDIDWLYSHLQKRKRNGETVPFLHELLEGCNVQVPKNKVIKRNPALEARCVKLRAQQEAREYRKMTKGVDNVRMRFPEDSIAYQLKHLNRQLIAIGQFIISIFAGFLFGFRGVEWMVGNLDFGFRLLLGVMCALVIALAEIYFLAKKLNEEMNIPETVQLGGPPKFANDPQQTNRPMLVTNKEHQE